MVYSQNSRSEWQVVWFIIAAAFLLGAVVFVLLGQASLQPWAQGSEVKEINVKVEKSKMDAENMPDILDTSESESKLRQIDDGHGLNVTLENDFDAYVLKTKVITSAETLEVNNIIIERKKVNVNIGKWAVTQEVTSDVYGANVKDDSGICNKAFIEDDNVSEISDDFIDIRL